MGGEMHSIPAKCDAHHDLWKRNIIELHRQIEGLTYYASEKTFKFSHSSIQDHVAQSPVEFSTQI